MLHHHNNKHHHHTTTTTPKKRLQPRPAATTKKRTTLPKHPHRTLSTTTTTTTPHHNPAAERAKLLLAAQQPGDPHPFEWKPELSPEEHTERRVYRYYKRMAELQAKRPQLPSYGSETDPATGTTTHPGYEGVSINPALLLTGEEKEKHYAAAWKLWKEEMNAPLSVCAPMVEQSELPFRLLTHKYHCDTAYTPMINGNLTHVKVNGSDISFDHLFETCEEDRPLTIQICGANIDKLLITALKLQHLGATDFNINLGCPQNIAKRGRYGSFLLEETLHVQRIIWCLKQHVSIPITVKMRKLLNDPTHERTLAYAKALQDTGASAIILHGRTRNNKQNLLGQADLEAIKKLKAHLTIPVMANGGVGSYFDLMRVKEYTKVDSVMISEGLLNYPSMMAYPIRRSQLLHKAHRSLHEEGLYDKIEERETAEERAHYGYPLFDTPELKKVALRTLPQEYHNLPELSPRTTIDELERIDTHCGPDPVHISKEMIHFTAQHREHWYQCLRPHIFKILQRDFYAFTDIRHVYSTSQLHQQMDFAILQMIRVKQLYCWDLYKKHCFAELKNKLGLSEDTPIEEVDSSKLTEEELGEILNSFDLEGLLKHLDVLTVGLENAEPPSGENGGVTTTDATTTTTTPIAQKENNNNDNTNTTMSDQTTEDKSSAQQQQQQEEKESQPTNTTTTTTTKQTFGPNPWLVDDKWKCVEIKYKLGTNRAYPMHCFEKQRWLNTYKEYMIENGYLTEIVVDCDEEQVEKKENENNNETSTTETTTTTTTQNKKTLLIPTIKGFDINYNDIGFDQQQWEANRGKVDPRFPHQKQHPPTPWTSRQIQDPEWVRVFRLNPNNTTNQDQKTQLTTIYEQKYKEYINKQKELFRIEQADPTLNQPQLLATQRSRKDKNYYEKRVDFKGKCVDLTNILLPLPLEALFFNEKLLSTQVDWYFRHGHVQEVKHVAFNEQAIQSQVESMRMSRVAVDDNREKLHIRQADDNVEEIKAAKLARKAAQRERDLAANKLKEEEEAAKKKAAQNSTTTTTTTTTTTDDVAMCDECTENMVPGHPGNDTSTQALIRAQRPPASDDEENSALHKKQRTE